MTQMDRSKTATPMLISFTVEVRTNEDVPGSNVLDSWDDVLGSGDQRESSSREWGGAVAAGAGNGSGVEEERGDR
jgi:hypothetical protein